MARKKKTEEKIEYSSKEEKLKALQKIIKQFNRSHDKELIKLGKKLEKERERISFGLKALDKLTGGGIPVGLFTVIWGNKSTGKTTLTYKIIAEAQKQDKIVAFFDLENTFDPDWAIKQGINIDELVLGYFNTAEEAMDALIVMAENKAVDLVVVDSIQAMSPKGEQRNKSGTVRSIEEDEMALLARKLSKFFRITAPKINEGNIAVVMIGQARMDIGGFIALETLSGGRCFDEKTRILTKDGYKTYKEIKVGDLIPTVNLEKNKIEYKPIKKIFIYENYKGKAVKFYNKYGAEFIFTPNHQCLVKQFKDGSLKYPIYKTILAEESRRTFAFPNCFPSGNSEYPISDDEIRFLAWCLTDSQINVQDKTATGWRKYFNKIVIYQTKHYKRIWDLLKRLNITIGLEFTVRRRKRVNSRPEFKNSKPSYEFYIKNAKKYIEKYKLTRDKLLPDWMFNLSDRQARIFLEELIYADGSIKKGKISVLHKGNLKWLERIQYFMALHNIPTSKIVQQSHKKCWSLYFQSADYVGFDRNQQEIIKNYDGLMWDIEVDNHFHFIERSGRIIITHNSLNHWASLIIKMRRGEKSNSPYTRIKDEKTGKTKKVIIGFDCVFKLEKKKIKSMPEGTEIHLPFIFEEGFEDVDVKLVEEEEKR